METTWFPNTRGIHGLSWDDKNKQTVDRISLKASHLYTHWSRPISQSDSGQNRNTYFKSLSHSQALSTVNATIYWDAWAECSSSDQSHISVGCPKSTHGCLLKIFYNAAFTAWSFISGILRFLPAGDIEEQIFNTSLVHLYLDFIRSLALKLKSDYPWRVLVSEEDINYL